MKPQSTLHCHHTHAVIRVIDAEIPADISVPANAHGLIFFGDGLSYGRHSPTQQRITRHFNENGFATLLADLVSAYERTQNTHSGELCCGLDLLERRVVTATDWIAMQSGIHELPLAYFGAGVGAEAALIAATRRPEMIRAVVACGADLDHIEPFLREIFAPTLLIWGMDDPAGLDRQRYRMLQFPEKTMRQLVVTRRLKQESVAGEIAGIALEWFRQYFKV